MREPDVLRLLVIADVHATISPRDQAALPGGRSPLGLELMRRAIEDARKRGPFDAIVLMGDVLNDGASPDAEATLRAVRDELDRSAAGVPLLVVPGNHDGDADRLLAVLGARTGGHAIGPYQFYVFADCYGEGDVCTRQPADQRAFLEWARRAGGPIVILQHNPLHPVIEKPYPYMLANRQEVMAEYAQAGVLLSLSGHYHQGHEWTATDGVGYLTAPALCETDYSYMLVTLRGREVSSETRLLKMPSALELVDTHAHTEFAYCGQGITADGIIERSRLFGLAGVRLVEHAPQLYCPADDFFIGRHVREPAVWRAAEHSRARQFRAAMEPRRDAFTRIGLEVELDADGRLTLHDEDRWVDLLVGAIHFLPADPNELSDAELGKVFLETCEGLVRGGIHVLAHPWRVFAWSKRPAPKDLYAALADLLAAGGVAAEINFHGNEPDPAFFAACIERGAKIAFGSDAHELHEAAAFGPHLAVLRAAAGSADPAVLSACLAAI